MPSRGAGRVRASRACLAGACALLPGAAPAMALPASPADLSRLGITSASRRAERLGDAAASGHVVTAEAIRRSGAGSALSHVGMLPKDGPAKLALPSYDVLDLRCAWKLQPGWTIAVAGRDLSGAHPEFGDSTARSEMARSRGAPLEWRE